MIIGQKWIVSMFQPVIGLWSKEHSFKANISVEGEQLTLNDVTFSNIRTVKYTIGGVGVAGCNFNFATATNQSEQVIDLGAAAIPANSRILDVRTYTDAVFTGAISLTAEVGTSSSGHELINSATIYATGAVLPMAADHLFTVVPAAAAHVYVAATPGANWSLVTAGKVSIFITYIEAI